jgi:hypothetical protein
MNKQDFIEQASEFIMQLDASSAYKFFARLTHEDTKEIAKNTDTKAYFYQLQFLISNFLSDKEVDQLFSKYLVIALKNDELDLVALTKRLFIGRPIFIRDTRKEELSKILVSSKEILFYDGATLISEKKFTTVGDWLLSYMTEVGFPGSIFKESQYFSKYLNNLPEDKKIILKKLFSLFKYLSNSSIEPNGFEDDLLFRDKMGRLVTTHKGRVIVLFDPNNKSKAGSSSSYSPNNGSVDEKVLLELKKFSSLNSSIETNDDTKGIQDILTDEDITTLENTEDHSLETEAINQEKAENTLSMNSLNSVLANYSPSSLEYKAIKEEIERIKKSQKSS